MGKSYNKEDEAEKKKLYRAILKEEILGRITIKVRKDDNVVLKAIIRLINEPNESDEGKKSQKKRIN